MLTTTLVALALYAVLYTLTKVRRWWAGSSVIPSPTGDRTAEVAKGEQHEADHQDDGADGDEHRELWQQQSRHDQGDTENHHDH